MAAEADVAFDPDFKKDERLFHYTSSAGLYGILESGCLWTTHYRFLNDSQELFRARDVIVEHVRKAVHARIAALKVNQEIHFKEGVDLRQAAEEEARVLVNAMYNSTLGAPNNEILGLGHPYVFSTFCCSPEHVEDFGNGVLLHWGTYARGGGYAVQLNPHKIKILLDLERERFPGLFSLSKKVHYLGADNISAELKDAFAKIGDVACRVSEANVKGKDLSDVDVGGSLEPFVKAICCTKDSFFSPEREARIVVMRSHGQSHEINDHEVHIRLVPGIAAPYIKLFEESLLKENCPIERILVGPHPDNDRRVVALHAYLRSRKLGQIQIDVSTVPYMTQLG